MTHDAWLAILTASAENDCILCTATSAGGNKHARAKLCPQALLTVPKWHCQANQLQCNRIPAQRDMLMCITKAVRTKLVWEPQVVSQEVGHVVVQVFKHI